MAADIVPELNKKIQKEYEKEIENNKQINKFLQNLEAEKATSKDVSLYAEQLGACASRAITKNITEENLPDGKIYWNILSRTVEPVLKDIHKAVNDAAEKVQKREDKANKIGIITQRAEFPILRMRDLFDKLISILENGDMAADE